VRLQKFRYNAAITVAAVVAFFGAVPLATSRVYLLPIALVPILVGVWSWRAGTDVDPAGLRIRATFGSRFVPWSHVAALVPADRRRVYAILTTGRQVRLPAVGSAQLATFSGVAAEKATTPDESADGSGDGSGHGSDASGRTHQDRRDHPAQ
jgi:hypothetical protein